ncbi:MAG: ABC transporter ATP-binding protein [Clostridia bacterium]|nr:ABC transporter ATP-binding protein [Clostridia bacterium]
MIRIRKLTKSFGDRVLFSGFRMEMPDKGAFALIGPSGCGKTTLLRIISGLDRDYSGDVDVSGKISYVFQEDRLVPSLSAYQNVFLVCGDRERTEGLLTAVGLSDDASGKEKDWEKRPDELSGGMKRRVAIARAMAFDHDILLLDEPFTALDRDIKDEIISLIREKEKDKLLVLVTHDASEADALNCERVFINSMDSDPV